MSRDRPEILGDKSLIRGLDGVLPLRQDDLFGSKYGGFVVSQRLTSVLDQTKHGQCRVCAEENARLVVEVGR